MMVVLYEFFNLTAFINVTGHNECNDNGNGTNCSLL